MRKNNSTKNSAVNPSNSFLRKMIVIFFIINTVIFINFTVLYTIHQVEPLFKLLMFIGALQHLAWLLGFLFAKDISIEPLILMYLTYAIVTLFPVVCIYWNAGYAVVFFWYLLVPLGAIAFRAKYIVVWILFAAVAVICTFLFSHIFPVVHVMSFIYQVNILTISSTISLAIFFTIVFVKINQMNESMHTEMEENVENQENQERNKALYNSIIEYLEQSESFKNPAFNAQTLAKALHSNVNYISRAINAGGSDDFRILLNKFRINYVKSMIDNGAMEKYTIDYIYSEAGYKHRSTFNNAFKSIIGMTPSDYVSANINDKSTL